MTSKVDFWSITHEKYATQDWITKPSLFAETAITYFPPQGKVLDLGAGQGQDSRFFAEHGYDVVSTDLTPAALAFSKAKLTDELQRKITLQLVDLGEKLPFAAASFDVVYAHLSLHYFDGETTIHLFTEIQRVLKPRGAFAFIVNSSRDPEYGTGEKIEDDYFLIDGIAKRYFNVAEVRKLVSGLDINVLDNHGETYKDNAQGIDGLVRFIGTKKLQHEHEAIQSLAK